MKPADECLLKTRFSVGRLNDLVLGMPKERKDHIRQRGWGNLLEVGSFSAPEGLLEWIIDRINPELGEFRNPRNNTSILFTKDMFIKVLGLPSGNRPVVLTDKYQESEHREFYKIDYDHGRRAPIHHAIDMLEKGTLDEETYFRTFFEVALGTYMCPGTGNMLPLEYLGSLDDSKQVKDYDWGAHILENVMSEVDAFQKKKEKNALLKKASKIWVGGCLPVLAIIFMDHLEFPESCLSVHHIDYSLPRASHVSDADFRFVMKHDKNKLTINPNAYGARPFRPFHMTPYANQHAPFGHQPDHPQFISVPKSNPPSNIHLPDATTRQEENSNMQVPDVTTHQCQTIPNQPTEVLLHASKQVMVGQDQTIPNKTIEELPDFMIPVLERHTKLWAKDIDDTKAILSAKHGTRMSEFARDVIAAMKVHTTPTPSFSSPPRSADVSNLQQAEDIASKATPETRFWNDVVQFAQEVEQSIEKSSRPKKIPDTPQAPTTATTNQDQNTSFPTIYDIEPPSFSLGGDWSQPPQEPTASLDDHVQQANVVTTAMGTTITETVAQPPSHAKYQETSGADQDQVGPIGGDKTSTVHRQPIASNLQYSSAAPSNGQITTTGTKISGPTEPLPSHEQDKVVAPEQQQPTSVAQVQRASVQHERVAYQIQDPSAKPATAQNTTLEPAHTEHSETNIAYTIGTQTQEKKNRKKRAFLGLNEANALKKLKTTNDSKELYYKYIMKQCTKPPKQGEKRPHFVDFGDHQISYEHFREALRPRGHINNEFMDLFIKNFNETIDDMTSSLHTCTKFAFSQSFTEKLLVDEEKFDPRSCLHEFNQIYKDNKLKSKDLLFFAIVDTEHWILCCINIIHKQINILDSMKRVHKTEVYEKADVLVSNFSKVASLAKAFQNTDFMQFVCLNPQDCRQEIALFNCGVHTMLHMKHWEGKILKPFCTKMIENRMAIAYMLLQSPLNKADPSWVLKKK
uniref:Uncharacterized protein n=1 Tax=Avena sativa TaxID=4498 RepID=A0ACD5UBS7_AVESA